MTKLRDAANATSYRVNSATRARRPDHAVVARCGTGQRIGSRVRLTRDGDWCRKEEQDDLITGTGPTFGLSRRPVMVLGCGVASPLPVVGCVGLTRSRCYCALWNWTENWIEQAMAMGAGRKGKKV